MDYDPMKPAAVVSEAKFAQVGEVCPNAACSYYGCREGRVVKFGQSRQGRQRYRCQHCKRCFCERTGTIFHGKRKPESMIIETLCLLSEGVRISSIARTKGLQEDTILQWVREAGAHAEALEEVLLRDYELSASQLDGLWSFVQVKGEKKLMKKRMTVGNSGA